MIETNLSRIKQLMGESIKKDDKIFKVELTKVGPDGKSYGIIREGQKYFIKVSDKTKNILEEDFKYISGLQNKTDFMYPTYAKAIKQLNLKFINLCEAYNSEYDVNTFLNDNIISESVENDIVCECSFQESDGEDEDDDTPDFKINKPSAKISESIKKKTIDETTFKLKVPNQDPQPVVQKQTTTQITPQQPQQEPAPQNDKPFNDEPFDAGVEADEESDPKKFIQQLSGKLGQSLRKYTDETGQPDYDLEKFAINSVVSATHTADMDENDRKDIISKINTAGGGEEQSNEPTDNQDNAPDENNGEENNQDEPESFGESMKMSENISIFAQTNKIRNMLRETFMRGTDLESVIDEVVNNTTVEPVVKPSVKPETTPSRRSKPFRVPVISPEDSPKPKAKM